MSHDVQFDGQFAEKVLVHLEAMCQEFLESIPYKLATKLTEEHPDLGHYSVMQAVDRFVQPDGDGSRDKAKEWLDFRTRDITAAFEAEFNQDDEDDDWDEDDNSDEYVARVEQVEQEGMSEAEKQRMRQSYEVAKSLEERRPDIYTRYIRWLGGDNNGYDEFVYFSSKGSQPGEEYSGENDPDDELIHYYGLDPKDAVPGYTNGEWVIVRY